MENIPNEILSNILINLSQRCIFAICSTVCLKWYQVIYHPSFYSTIHIYTEQQLGKVIQLAKRKKLINNKPIGYYVNRFIFHYECSPNIIMHLSTFPDLQQMDGLGNDLKAAYNYNSIYLQLKRPIDFFYLYTDHEHMSTFNGIKHNLKSLNIYMTKDLLKFVPELQQQVDTIFIKSIKEVTEVDYNELYVSFPLKILLLPTTSLKNLTKLKIHFLCHITAPNYRSLSYDIDEHTFENIHQSCPLLESLSLEDFYMDISDGYINNENIISTHHLINLDINRCIFKHSSCIQYFITKYPHLESLSLDVRFKWLPSEEIEQYQNAFLNMLLQLPLLNHFSYKYKQPYNEVWSINDFIQWLDKHPNQLIHLDYSFPLTTHVCENMNSIENISNRTSLPPLIQQEKQLFGYLNHLTSLSLFLDDMINLVFVYLSENTNSIIVSTTLEKLKIKQYTSHTTEFIYIYDWLDMFPNLLSFSTDYKGHIRDNSGFFNGDNDKNNSISNQLHRYIMKRKQQYQQNYTLNKEKNDYPSYKLMYLGITFSFIWFENGFDQLLKECQQLKRLVLNNVRFIVPTMGYLNEIYFDLSLLHLELLKMNKVSCVPFNDSENICRITKLNIDESLTNINRVFKKNHCDAYFGLNIKCKYIDGFTCDFL